MAAAPAPSVTTEPFAPIDVRSPRLTESKRMGLHVDTGAWMAAGVKLPDGLAPLKDRVLSVNLGDRTSMGAKGSRVTPGAGVAPIAQFLTQLSRLQPPNIQPDWPPTTDGGA